MVTEQVSRGTTSETNKRKTKGTTINEQYFSGVQTSLFIGDVWIDDILSVDYQKHHNRQPIYGYGSQHFDFMPKGTILVTGSLTINFREPNYLWMVLDRYKTFNTRKESRLQDQKKLEASLKATTYEGDRRERFDDFFNQVNPNDAKKSLIEQAREFNGIPENNAKENFNHVAFDILMGYGYNLGPNSPGETIRNIHIMNKIKTINSDGRPIAEQYSFMARDVS